jgi:ASCH domain
MISIRQPWATLIVRGLKDIENRSWATRYRGPVLVHASQRPSFRSLADIARQFDIDLPQVELPVGGIVGVTNIIDCVDAHPSPWFEGKFGFILDRSRGTALHALEGIARSTLSNHRAHRFSNLSGATKLVHATWSAKAASASDS